MQENVDFNPSQRIGRVITITKIVQCPKLHKKVTISKCKKCSLRREIKQDVVLCSCD